MSSSEPDGCRGQGRDRKGLRLASRGRTWEARTPSGALGSEEQGTTPPEGHTLRSGWMRPRGLPATGPRCGETGSREVAGGRPPPPPTAGPTPPRGLCPGAPGPPLTPSSSAIFCQCRWPCLAAMAFSWSTSCPVHSCLLMLGCSQFCQNLRSSSALRPPSNCTPRTGHWGRQRARGAQRSVQGWGLQRPLPPRPQARLRVPPPPRPRPPPAEAAAQGSRRAW